MNPVKITRALVETGVREAVRASMPVLGPVLDAVLGDLEPPVYTVTTVGEPLAATFPCSSHVALPGEALSVLSHDPPGRGVWVQPVGDEEAEQLPILLSRPQAHTLGRLLLGV